LMGTEEEGGGVAIMGIGWGGWSDGRFLGVGGVLGHGQADGVVECRR